MINRSRITRIGILLILLVSGVSLLTRPVGPAPEGVTHQRAIGAFASAGLEQTVDNETPAIQVQAVEPVTVNLADVPAGVYDPNNQYDLWKAGKIDLENESLRSEAEIAALQRAALELAPSNRLQLAASGPGLSAPALGVNFDSIDINDCCGGGANVPPDPELAAGPNHLIAAVNVSFEIYDKIGTSLMGPTTFASFMAADPNCTGVFDPNVLYDEKEDRFILGIDANGTHYCAAVSQTGDPTGLWNIYSFPTASGVEFFDYPHAGVGEDAIFVGANIFGAVSFLDSRVWALEKAAMVQGLPASFLVRNLGINEDTPQPMNAHGWNQGTWPANRRHYMLSETAFNGADHTLWLWDGPFSGPNTFSSVATIDLNAATGTVAGFPIDVQQAGGGGSIQANDWRPQDFEYRNGFGWTTMTVACNPGAGTVDCVRWAQIELTTGAIGPAGAGVISSSGDHRFFPDLAVNECNDMVVGYTKSSTSMFPSVWFTGREDADPAGVLQAEAELKAGEIAYTAFDGVPRRWGDYTGMTIAPDGQTFWYLGEYGKDTGNPNGRWGTYIGSFTYASCGGPGPAVHSGDLDGRTRRIRSNWRAVVSVRVHDDTESRIANAIVEMTVTPSSGGPVTRSCTTNATGICRVRSPRLSRNADDSVTFSINSITATGFSYDVAQNHDPDGDSDGTTIVIQEP